jgi:SAM-dependent methyltransferase
MTKPTVSHPDKYETTADDWAATRGQQWAAHLAPMEATLMPIDEPLIEALQLDAPRRIAEAGCGGGGTALELLRRARPGSAVHGFDISPTLIELARRRAGEGSAIVFEVADMSIAAPERPYERLVSRFGVMSFAHPREAFANLARWLEPGGRFAFAVWGPPSENPWMTSVREVVARTIELPRVDPDAPGPFRYADADVLLRLLQASGFDELTVRSWRGALAVGGGMAPLEASQFVLSAFSSFGELLAAAGSGALDEVRRGVTACFSEHRQDGAVRMGACVHIVSGARAR